MGFLLEHSTVIGIGIVLLIVFVNLKGLKQPKNDYRLIKFCATQNSWAGNLQEAELLSWKQTKSTHKYDYYIFSISLDINGSHKKVEAAAVVKVSEVPRLKKGLKVIVKYQGVNPNKIAVVDTVYND